MKKRCISAKPASAISREKEWSAHNARLRFKDAFRIQGRLPRCAKSLLLLESSFQQPFDGIVTFADGSVAKVKIFHSSVIARHYRHRGGGGPFITVAVLFDHDHATVVRNVYTQLGSYYAERCRAKRPA